MVEAWTKLEEHRTYSGEFVEVVAAQFKVEAHEALEQGYLPEALAWSGGDGEHVLTVTFIYDPKRARPA